jgi:hypothetical protein
LRVFPLGATLFSEKVSLSLFSFVVFAHSYVLVQYVFSPAPISTIIISRRTLALRTPLVPRNLQGIALTGDPTFDLFRSSQPYVASRALELGLRGELGSLAELNVVRRAAESMVARQDERRLARTIAARA